ncbi:hypothetical protein ANCCEY_14682 [Ancylostoma ceylanicum]|uniref:7TM GPCR serpentine receptor class x (Srx) domain-containing protein n=1 Tax=Ancylostoma ceylanicum TaxID=53326 RepID=A0A0D6LEZ0_9BILA|nr:hypothetical protein ANCCEY_14682 [Ancylostoma ceylanicum]
MEETEEINFVEPSALDWIEAVLVLVISSFGFLINTGSLFVMVRSDSFKNAFGYITAYQAFCRASLLLIFAVWATPWTLFPVPEGVDGLNSFLGQLSLFFEEIACHCCLLLAANRVTLIYFNPEIRRHFVAACGFFRVLKNSIITGHPRSVATVSAYKMETAGPMRVC